MRDNAKSGALTEVTFYILLSLYTPKHGYAVMQFVEEKTGGRLSLGAGTLYGALNSLQDKKWIEPYPKRRTSMITRFQGIKHNLIEENRAKKNGGMWRPVKIAPTQADEGHLQFPLKTFVE